MGNNQGNNHTHYTAPTMMGLKRALIFHNKREEGVLKEDRPLFVFLIVGPKQNAGSLLTPVSGTVFHALSHGTFGFTLHGSLFNQVLIGGKSSTANQIL